MLNEGLLSEEILVLYQWESERQKIDYRNDSI